MKEEAVEKKGWRQKNARKNEGSRTKETIQKVHGEHCREKKTKKDRKIRKQK